jgi:uncharacterized linocin/CFP29 family protein
MTNNDPQVPWTDEQWARVQQVIHEEASRARVAATFLPLVGPLPASTDFVRDEAFEDAPGKGTEEVSGSANKGLGLADQTTIRLKGLQVRVYARGAQLSDPEMTSVLALFRRAANLLARLEDAVIFNGQNDKNTAPGAPPLGEIRGGQPSRGLFSRGEDAPYTEVKGEPADLVTAVSESIGKLEKNGHYGPFAVVLGQTFFTAAQTPNKDSLVLPQDRIVPFLGGGPLLRSTLLGPEQGVVVALGGAPVELVVAKDASASFMQLTTDPAFVFRVYERMVLRIKQADAIIALIRPAPPPAKASNS